MSEPFTWATSGRFSPRGARKVNARSLLNWFYSVPLLGALLFIFSVGFPPFDDATALDLTTHMIQHIAIVSAGIMIAYPLHRKGYFRAIEGKYSGWVGLAIIVALMAYWHLPANWDAAVLNPAVHAVEHSCFLLVGILIGSSLQTLSDRAKIDVLLLGFFGHFFYGLILISPGQIYPLYSVADQGVLGVTVFSFGPLYWTGIFYLIFRNRAWLKEVSTTGVEIPEVDYGNRSASGRPRLRRAGRIATAVSSVALIALLVGFYATSAVAITFTPVPQHSPSTVQVTIVETPITWNYYPQNVTVVLGVNSTVTWVSHSLAYDTVTADGGAFDSGSIAPGGTFTFTFSSPGTYDYHCIYHPWMTGTIKVISPTSG